MDTVTVTHTTDLVVHYHGRAINTQLLEEEVRSPLEMLKKFYDIFTIIGDFEIIDSSNQYMSRW